MACPKKGKQNLGAQQAVAAEPGMFSLVDEESAKMKDDDEDRMYGLATWYHTRQ